MKIYFRIRFKKSIYLSILFLFLTGCVSMSSFKAFRPPDGILFSLVKVPLTTNFDSTPVCSKYGEASTIYIHDAILTGLDFAFRGCDIKRAAENGGITTVEYADYEYFQILGVVGIMKVKAYGK